METFLKVKFMRFGRTVSVQVVQAPPLAALECFIKDERSREYYKENDAWCSSKGYDVVLRDFNMLHYNALSIAYSDYEDNKVTTCTYESEVRARTAVREFTNVIRQLNDRMSAAAEVTIAG